MRLRKVRGRTVWTCSFHESYEQSSYIPVLSFSSFLHCFACSTLRSTGTPRIRRLLAHDSHNIPLRHPFLPHHLPIHSTIFIIITEPKIPAYIPLIYHIVILRPTKPHHMPLIQLAFPFTGLNDIAILPYHDELPVTQ
jgi:hypothetical protein